MLLKSKLTEYEKGWQDCSNEVVRRLLDMRRNIDPVERHSALKWDLLTELLNKIDLPVQDAIAQHKQ